MLELPSLATFLHPNTSAGVTSGYSDEILNREMVRAVGKVVLLYREYRRTATGEATAPELIPS